MDLVLEDTIFTQSIGVNDTINYNGNNYTIDSPEARYTESNWENFPGFTLKLGANWNISEYSNVFFNSGILSKAQGLIMCLIMIIKHTTILKMKL